MGYTPTSHNNAGSVETLYILVFKYHVKLENKSKILIQGLEWYAEKHYISTVVFV